MGGYEAIFIQPILTHTTKFKKIQLQTTNRISERFTYKRFCLNEMYANNWRSTTGKSAITFSREAKYGTLISLRIVYGGLRAYIYSTYIKICLFNVKI